MSSKKCWTVYKHIFPDGKVYIGIPSDLPENRWNNGFGYENHRKLFKKIVSDGWNNIKHEILFERLTETEARRIEKEAISDLLELNADNVLNTAYNPKVDTPKNWFNSTITEKTLRNYSFIDFYFDDKWIDFYDFFNSRPFSARLYIGYVEMTWFFMNTDNNVEVKICRIYYPESVITYSDLYYFLSECKHDVVWVKGQHEPILKNE